MLTHVLRATLQWACLLPLRVLMILAGLVVVPLALPFRVMQGPVQRFSQAAGDWVLILLPSWAWLWSRGQASVEDDPGKGGWRLLLATHRKTGRRFYGFYWVWQWSATRALVVQLGFKGEPEDWADDYSTDPSKQWKGFTFELNPWKGI